MGLSKTVRLGHLEDVNTITNFNEARKQPLPPTRSDNSPYEGGEISIATPTNYCSGEITRFAKILYFKSHFYSSVYNLNWTRFIFKTYYLHISFELGVWSDSSLMSWSVAK